MCARVYESSFNHNRVEAIVSYCMYIYIRASEREKEIEYSVMCQGLKRGSLDNSKTLERNRNCYSFMFMFKGALNEWCLYVRLFKSFIQFESADSDGGMRMSAKASLAV